VIQTEKLTKHFRVREQKDSGMLSKVRSLFFPTYSIKTAVDSISFHIKEGELVGYIGLNGAGKTTTIRLLTGILRPSSGFCRVFDCDPFKNRQENCRHIGAVFGQRSQLWWDLPVRDSYDLLAKVFSVSSSEYCRTLDWLVEELDLNELLTQPVRTLSLGQKMRCELAAALLHQPRLLLLDEPTIGLDVVIKARLRKIIKKVNQENTTTVLLTTHDLRDIEKLCSRVIVIDQGRLIFDGKLSDFKAQVGVKRLIECKLADPIHRDALVDLRKEGLSTSLYDDGYRVIILFDSQRSARSVMDIILNHLPVVDFTMREPDLESAVRQLSDRTP
jgi:ABC-2 type transport system ATP-binding protein